MQGTAQHYMGWDGGKQFLPSFQFMRFTIALLISSSFRLQPGFKLGMALPGVSPLVVEFGLN